MVHLSKFSICLLSNCFHILKYSLHTCLLNCSPIILQRPYQSSGSKIQLIGLGKPVYLFIIFYAQVSNTCWYHTLYFAKLTLFWKKLKTTSEIPWNMQAPQSCLIMRTDFWSCLCSPFYNYTLDTYHCGNHFQKYC